MYWKQFCAWGELNRLINKCSTFMFFDLIRKCGRHRQTTADKDHDELRRLQGQPIQLQQLLHNPTIWKEYNYGDKIVWIVLEAKCQWCSKWIKSALKNGVNKVPYWYIHCECKQSPKLWEQRCATEHK